MNKAEWKALWDGVTTHTEAAEAVKASGKGSTEKKISKAATSLVDLLGEAEGLDTEATENLVSALDALVAEMDKATTEVFDLTEGQQYADAIGALLETPILRPETFGETEAREMLARWKAATGRKPRGEGSGDANMVGVPVKITFDYPEGSEIDLRDWVRHNSTESSLSNEISKRARIIDGIAAGTGYKRPESASKEWKAAMAAIKAGETGPWVVNVPTGKGNMKATMVVDA